MWLQPCPKPSTSFEVVLGELHQRWEIVRHFCRTILQGTQMSYTKQEIEARGHPVWAEVDLSAIRHNTRVLGEIAPGAEVMGVVKGYAYGHGNPECGVAMLEGGA